MQPIFTIKNKKHWYQKDKIVLTEPFIVSTNGAVFKLSKGFDSDGASIPRFLWWFSNPFDSQVISAALVHDAAYWSRKLKRNIADRVFYALMRKNKTPFLKALLFYIAVRLGGWWGYYITPLWEGRPSKKEISKYLFIGKVRQIK